MANMLEKIEQEAGLNSIVWAVTSIRDGWGLDYHLRMLALEFAEHVLPIFESRRPGDLRVRAAIDAGQQFYRGQGLPGAVQAAIDALSRDFADTDPRPSRDGQVNNAAVEFVVIACYYCFHVSPTKAVYGASQMAAQAVEQHRPLSESRRMLHARSPNEEGWQSERLRDWLKRPKVREILASIQQSDTSALASKSHKPRKPVPKQRMEMSIVDDARFAVCVMKVDRPVICFFHPGTMEPEELNVVFRAMDRALSLIIDCTDPKFALIDDYFAPETVKRECGGLKLPLVKVYRGGDCVLTLGIDLDLFKAKGKPAKTQVRDFMIECAKAIEGKRAANC